MTQTAIDLWNDIDFINKRIDEQIAYIDALIDSELSGKRKEELRNSAESVLVRFLIREKELTN